MKYHNIMNIECFLNYLKENEIILELLSGKKIIKNNTENNNEDKVKDNNPILRVYIKQRCTQSNNHNVQFSLKQHEKTTLELLLNAPRKVRG